MAIHAARALLPEGWVRDLRVGIGADRITEIARDTAPQPGDIVVAALLPGTANLHSHAFQRGFSGLSERRGEARDSFWTWRQMMYHFALRLSPEEMESIAALAYVEMLEAGYTRVGEFHYLHNAYDGAPYDDPAEMSARIFAAAEATGIALTHLPVFYAHGGFGPVPAGADQRRFLNDADSFERLMVGCAALLVRPQDRLGVAPHSLRAASSEDIARLAAKHRGKPFHIHVAEQEKEVEDCVGHTGARPVEWLLDHADVDRDWCLIHATHMTDAETEAVAASGAVAGLCPITEANLGDGIFPADRFLAAGGRFGIGTDSNVEITLAGELRMLEYGQRLALRARNIISERRGSTGARLFHEALAGGAQALGAPRPEIAPGAAADLVAIADRTELGVDRDTLLDRWIFGRDVQVEDVWAAGRHLVKSGRHVARDAVENAARKTLAALLSR